MKPKKPTLSCKRSTIALFLRHLITHWTFSDPITTSGVLLMCGAVRKNLSLSTALERKTFNKSMKRLKWKFLRQLLTYVVLMFRYPIKSKFSIKNRPKNKSNKSIHRSRFLITRTRRREKLTTLNSSFILIPRISMQHILLILRIDSRKSNWPNARNKTCNGSQTLLRKEKCQSCSIYRNWLRRSSCFKNAR